MNSMVFIQCANKHDNVITYKCKEITDYRQKRGKDVWRKHEKVATPRGFA